MHGNSTHQDAIVPYIQSLRNPTDYTSGDYNILEGDLGKKYGRWESVESDYYEAVASRLVCKEELKEMRSDLLKSKEEFLSELKIAYDSYQNKNQNYSNDMKESEEPKKKTRSSKKKETPEAEPAVKAETAPEKKAEAAQKAEAPQEKKAERRPPQAITESGEKVTNAHVYKSNKSEDWFFTAKINDVPLKPQLAAKEDVETLLSGKADFAALMWKYYPTKMQAKVDPQEFKVPFKIQTPEGEKTVHKFNAYKEKDERSYDYGKYRFYLQIEDYKTSMPAPKAELNAYFDRTMKPADIVSRVFGEQLHLADHYKQFKVPEGVTEKDIHIMKNKETNRYEISANIGGIHTPSKELSYNDRQSYFSFKTANREQLAGKYLSTEISQALEAAPKKQAKMEQPQLKF